MKSETMRKTDIIRSHPRPRQRPNRFLCGLATIGTGTVQAFSFAVVGDRTAYDFEQAVNRMTWSSTLMRQCGDFVG
ncbi:hypothetical protein EON65_49535 [archaeon]|nr:MAG: hypothetical protein EON65_49535 [archaeon]